ncbi:heterokaryon incompatibility protein-domain-containing protein [Diaporthe sp. PMI_573]|nr:heterokaryon incompatibility protein-domain-containing protein [Diaporthaceae sp. PMI_573]
MESFEYQPLCGSEIRLVRFVPINPEDSGKAWSSIFKGLHLEHHDLATAPPYLALSYVWGDTTNQVPVEINGRFLPVTGNLCQALAYIWVYRDELERGLTAVSAPPPDANDGKSADCQRVLYLWIDALCINQASFDERAVQVPRMAAIYSTACTTLAWLGQLPLDEGKLPVHLESLLELFDATVPVAPFPRRHFPKPQAGGDPKENRMRTLMGVLKIYMGLMNNPWFRRMWVFGQKDLSWQAPYV